MPARVVIFVLGSVLLWTPSAGAREHPQTAAALVERTRPVISIPRLSHPPAVEDFLSMQPSGAVAQRMVKVSRFIQRDPQDGVRSSQRTEVYLGYDDKDIYFVFICFDDQPRRTRARLSRREDIFDDDTVEVMLDTFHDERRAYVFQANALGVQWDGTYAEQGQGDFGNFDSSWDTVWDSRGRLTPQGFVVLIAIPFKSLRFSSDKEQSWGIILNRTIPRTSENTFWPEITRRVDGRLNQEATLRGMEGISPGRNMQFIPYGIFRSFRAVDTRDPLPYFEAANQGRFGLDSKFIVHDSLVLDVTANPDFSQVESDQPQITTNQRYEVFFPEKRPFFLENADYFSTPIDLVFTRRIEDPQLGTRLTGRQGPYSLGMFVVDDRGPGYDVADGDPSSHKDTYFGIARLKRDLARQSSVGAIFTDREFAGSFNRVGGLDTQLKLDENWTVLGQAVASSTRNLDGTYQAGPAYKGDVQYNDLHTNYELQYNDISPNFVSEPGYVPRVDMREIRQAARYQFRPEGSFLLAWGPELFFNRIYGHDGTFLDGAYEPHLTFQFKGQTYVSLMPYASYPEQLRPVDFSTLPAVASYNQHLAGGGFSTQYFRWFTMDVWYGRGTGVNYDTPTNHAPILDNNDIVQLEMTLHPSRSLKIDNTYLLNRLADRSTGMSAFTNHVIRSEWNYQITRALSLRLIPQYTTVLANPRFTSLPRSKQFNADFLITYLVHPSTAIYVGYNSDLQNLVSPLGYDVNGNLLHTRGRYLNDGRQFFVKLSYLLRF
ncbi:MAG TPA: DUF5916 domain-containing protein [Terriglobales bacterium]|nr:DUF5916 domain-containing protein [Terriglobales bacterium]